MKKTIAIILTVCACLIMSSCGPKDYVLNEDTFFLVMTNMLYYPEQYLESTIELDCFTYELQDVSGEKYICGVRKCSAGYGCTCGNDTIIGFVLEGGDFPEPRNQSEDSNDKAWVHLKGTIKSTDKVTITIHSYLPDGSIDPDNTEQVAFLTFVVESCELIDDYSNLHYYVTN